MLLLTNDFTKLPRFGEVFTFDNRPIGALFYRKYAARCAHCFHGEKRRKNHAFYKKMHIRRKNACKNIYNMLE